VQFLNTSRIMACKFFVQSFNKKHKLSLFLEIDVKNELCQRGCSAVAVAELLGPPGGVKDLDLAIRRNVHARGAFVHDQQFRVAQDKACEAEQLPLADAEGAATVADIAFEATRECLHRLLHLGAAQCLPNLDSTIANIRICIHVITMYYSAE
jgi:hypothetical protein